MASALPLAGIRVLDLSRVLAGPLATQRLADLGAHVIKVERPGTGDETRHWGPPWQPATGQSTYFTSVNRGKRSVALDFASPQGKEILFALAASADVVIHNLLHSSAAKLGLTKAAFEAASPGIVICSISGFGPHRQPDSRPGYDLIAQAESGLMSITGSPSGEPSKVGVAIVDVLTGLEAATAILATLVGRKKTDEAVEIEVSLLDSAMAGMVNVGQGVLATGSDGPRYGNAHASIVPYETFGTREGQIVLAASNDLQWQRLCSVLGDDSLSTDVRFQTNPDRVENRDELLPLIHAALAVKDAGEWIEVISGVGVPCGMILSVNEGIAAAKLAGDRVSINLSDGTEVIAAPARINGEVVTALEPPASLGQHTDEVLSEIGISGDQIESLRASGVLG